MTAVPGAVDDLRPVELRDYYLVLRARWYHVAIGAGLGLVLALLYAAATPAVYEASSSVLLNPLTADPLQQLESTQVVDTSTERQVATSLEVAQRVVDEGGVDVSTSADSLLQGLEVTAAEDADVLRFTYRAQDPERAAARANAFAITYLDTRGDRARDALFGVRDTLDERLTTIIEERATLEDELDELLLDEDGDGVPDGSESDIRAVEASLSSAQTRQALTQSELEGMSAGGISGGRVITPALAPTEPSGLAPAIIALLGLLVGGLLGIISAFTRNSLDERLVLGDEVATTVGRPTLGSIVDPRPARRRPTLDPATTAGPMRRVGVTLGTTMDVRRPAVVALLAPDREETAMLLSPGLAEGLATREEVVVVRVTSAPEPELAAASTVFDEVSRREARSRADGVGKPDWVQVTPSGSADIARVDLSDPSMPDTLSGVLLELVDHYDLLVTAVPSLDRDTVALELGGSAHAVVVPVVRLRHARRDDLRQTMRDLRTAGVTIPGAIVVGPRRSWGHPEPLAPAPPRASVAEPT